jgi:hypothetical protein
MEKLLYIREYNQKPNSRSLITPLVAPLRPFELADLPFI